MKKTSTLARVKISYRPTGPDSDLFGAVCRIVNRNGRCVEVEHSGIRAWFIIGKEVELL